MPAGTAPTSSVVYTTPSATRARFNARTSGIAGTLSPPSSTGTLMYGGGGPVCFRGKGTGAAEGTVWFASPAATALPLPPATMGAVPAATGAAPNPLMLHGLLRWIERGGRCWRVIQHDNICHVTSTHNSFAHAPLRHGYPGEAARAAGGTEERSERCQGGTRRRARLRVYLRGSACQAGSVSVEGAGGLYPTHWREADEGHWCGEGYHR